MSVLPDILLNKEGEVTGYNYSTKLRVLIQQTPKVVLEVIRIGVFAYSNITTDCLKAFETKCCKNKIHKARE